MSGTGLLGVSGPEHREIVSQDVGANHGRQICGGLGVAIVAICLGFLIREIVKSSQK